MCVLFLAFFWIQIVALLFKFLGFSRLFAAQTVDRNVLESQHGSLVECRMHHSSSTSPVVHFDQILVQSGTHENFFWREELYGGALTSESSQISNSTGLHGRSWIFRTWENLERVVNWLWMDSSLPGRTFITSSRIMKVTNIIFEIIFYCNFEKHYLYVSILYIMGYLFNPILLHRLIVTWKDTKYNFQNHEILE
jgi:hypothetical protein